MKRGKPDGNQDCDDDTKSRPRAATATDEEDVAALDEPTIPSGHFTDPNQFTDKAECGDGLPFESSGFEYIHGKQYSNDELIDLGMSETLPPLEVIEELYGVSYLICSSSLFLTRLIGMNASLLRSTTTCRLYNLAAITRPFMVAL